MVIQLLLHISAYTFVHQSEVTKTMLSITPLCLKAWSKIRTILRKTEKVQQLTYFTE